MILLLCDLRTFLREFLMFDDTHADYQWQGYNVLYLGST